MPQTISNGSATTSQKIVLNPRDAGAVRGRAHRDVGDVSEPRARWSRSGTREIAFPPLPLVAIYEVREGQIVVLRILHGAQRWPSAH